MDSTVPEPQFAIPFYGLQSKKRNLSIQRNLENCSKRLKDEKIPNVYHSRILGPSACWQTFYRQNEALDFVRHKTEDLHVFAFECRQPDKQSGQRQFLTATYDVFWHYYMQLDESQRHHYEVIPEGHPCKLYFDLEFHKPANPAADGEMMVDTLIKYVCCWLRELYGVRCDRDTVLELSASTETKFSRHLIFQLEGSVFRDNVTAGEFVHAMFGLLQGHLDGETEHANNNSNNNSNNNNNRRSQEAGLLHSKAHGTETAETCHSAGPVVVPSPSPAVPSPSTAVPSPSTAVPSPSPAVPSPSTAVPSPSTAVPSPSTAVPSPSTAVPSPSTAVPSPSTAVPSPSTAVPSPSTAVPSPSTAVPSPSTAVPSPSTAVPSPSTGDCGGKRWGGCRGAGDCGGNRWEGCRGAGDCGGKRWGVCRGAVELSRNTERGSKAESCPEKRITCDTASCGSSGPAHCRGALPAADLEGCACEATDTSPSCSSPLKDASPCNKAEHGENPPECTAHREKKGPCAHKEQTFGRVGGKHAPHSENIACKWHDREEAPSGKKTAPILGSVDSKASRNVSGGEGREGKEEEGAAEGVGASRERMHGLQGRVWSQLEAEELSALVVRDREGRDTCFADLGVYTKNRNFRLYKSCKLGKTTAFTLSENSTYTVTNTADDAQRERQLFLASLITSVRGGERLLTFGHRARGPGLSPRPGRQSRSVRSDGDAGAMSMGGCGGSPYPEVDAFISGQVGHRGGWTRRWSYFPPAQTLSYDIAGYRFCHRLQRQHRSNNIRLVADLRRGVWYQRCYDPDCQAGNFRSEEFKLPDSVLPASYFTEDFEEADNNIDDDDKNVDDTMDDDDKNVDDTMDDDDEVCLLAVQQAEQDLTSAVGPN